MALITCPECGKQVSNAAGACPNCGYPLRNQTSKRVRIKIPDSLASANVSRLFRTSKVDIRSSEGQSLWVGPMGTPAVFELDNEDVIDIAMEYGDKYTTLTGFVEPGREYTVEFLRYKGLGIMKDPIYGLFDA